MINRFPWCVVNIDMPAQEVDVNVHPAKTEVRFRDPMRISRLMTDTFKNSIKNQAIIPKVFPNTQYKQKESDEVVLYKTPLIVQIGCPQ